MLSFPRNKHPLHALPAPAQTVCVSHGMDKTTLKQARRTRRAKRRSRKLNMSRRDNLEYNPRRDTRTCFFGSLCPFRHPVKPR